MPSIHCRPVLTVRSGGFTMIQMNPNSSSATLKQLRWQHSIQVNAESETRTCTLEWSQVHQLFTQALNSFFAQRGIKDAPAFVTAEEFASGIGDQLSLVDEFMSEFGSLKYFEGQVTLTELFELIAFSTSDFLRASFQRPTSSREQIESTHLLLRRQVFGWPRSLLCD